MDLQQIGTGDSSNGLLDSWSQTLSVFSMAWLIVGDQFEVATSILALLVEQVGITNSYIVIEWHKLLCASKNKIQNNNNNRKLFTPPRRPDACAPMRMHKQLLGSWSTKGEGPPHDLRGFWRVSCPVTEAAERMPKSPPAQARLARHTRHIARSLNRYFVVARFLRAIARGVRRLDKWLGISQMRKTSRYRLCCN